MGRLIDADKLKEYLQNRLKEAEEKFAYEESKKIARHTTKLLCDDADAQETVEAISIDWIKEYVARLEQISYWSDVRAIEAMVIEWKDEQGNASRRG